MTDKQRYKRTFSVLHASESNLEEVSTMKKAGRAPIRRLVTVCAVVVMLIAMAGVAYAADVGDIQETIHVWLHGEKEVQASDGSTTYTITVGEVAVADGDSEAVEPSMSEDEIAERLNGEMPDIQYLEDGRVIVHFDGEEIDITDKFVDGECVIPLDIDGHAVYLTIVYGEGWTMHW